MNLWAFAASMWKVFEAAMDERTEDGEVLLPVVVDRLLHGTMDGVEPSLRNFLVYTSDEHCVGVTHPGDLHLVQDHINREVAEGLRAPFLNGSLYR
jgi:hypothetical protein